MMLRALLALLFLSAPAWAAKDLSDYRTATYGSPTHYCDLSLSIAAPSGSGTLGDPWNATRCMSQPVAGNVVGILPGVSATLTQGADWNYPAFMPANSGTSGNPIVYVTKYPAVSLTYSTITSNANRTEIRRAGTGDNADVVQPSGATQAGAAFGVNTKNYITFDGFFVDMQYSQLRNDAGIIMNWYGTGNTFKNFVIKGTTTDCDSNCVLLRSEGSTNETWSNFLIQDYDNVPTGGGLNQQGFAGAFYGDQNYTVEYFTVINADNGIMPKGTVNSNTVFNYGVFRYGIVRDVRECFRFNDFDATNLTTMHHVLCDNFAQIGLGITSETSAPRNFLVHHVTFADTPASDANFHGPLYLKNDTSSSNVEIRDSIWDYLNGGQGAAFEGSEAVSFPSFPITMNYNAYYHAGATIGWTYASGTPVTTIAAWRTLSGQDANAQALSTSPFTNRATNDFTIAGGHAALTASSTGGEIGAYEGSIDPGVDTNGTTSGANTVGAVGGVRFNGTVRIQ